MRHCVLVIISGCLWLMPAAHASAQTSLGDKIRAGVGIGINSAKVGLEVREVFKGLSAKQACGELKKWIGAAPSLNGAARAEDVFPFVDDPRFSPSFGKAYDALGANDFKKFQQVQQQCQKDRLLSSGETAIVSFALNAANQPALVGELTTARSQRARVEPLVAETDALPATEDGVRRLDGIERELAQSKYVPAESRAAAGARVDAARARILPPVCEARVSAALAGAHGLEGITALIATRREIANWGLPAEPATALSERVTGGIADLAAPIVAEEKRAVAALPPGLPGLERGVKYLATFDGRFHAIAPDVPALAALRRDLIAKRAADVSKAQTALIADVRKARTEADVSQILGRYLTPPELEGAGSGLAAAARDRTATLRRVAENARVFGAPPAAGKAGTGDEGLKAKFLATAAARADYNEPQIIKSIFDADLGGLPSGMFVRVYLLGQARTLAEECKVFKLSEIREFEQRAVSNSLPSQQEMLNGIGNFLKALQDPSALLAAGASQQRLEDASQLAEDDLQTLAETYGTCDSPYIKRYARNVGGYLRNARR